MFFNDGAKCHMTCVLRVRDTQGRGYFKTPNKILKQIKGLRYEYTEEGLIYISGRVDSRKFLNLVGKYGDKIEVCDIKTGDQYAGGQHHAMYPYGTVPPMTMPMPMPMPMPPYPPYHRRGYYPSPMPDIQYHDFGPYHPHLPYY